MGVFALKKLVSFIKKGSFYLTKSSSFVTLQGERIA